MVSGDTHGVAQAVLIGACLVGCTEHRVPAASVREYRITTRSRSGEHGTGTASWSTALTVAVYAVLDRDRWHLANALPRHTRGWRRSTVGPITYVYAPSYPYDPARAQRAVAFVDSVAAVFDVPRLAPLTYYLTSSVDEVYQIMGLESDVKYGAGRRGLAAGESAAVLRDSRNR